MEAEKLSVFQLVSAMQIFPLGPIYDITDKCDCVDTQTMNHTV